MKIQYCSDLHLEFLENEKLLKKKPLEVKGDILILAGDILTLKRQKDFAFFFDFCAANFKQTFWIAGNHEFYGADVSHYGGSFQKEIRPNVHFLNNTAILYDDIRLIFSTLWSEINPSNEWLIERRMNDFKQIQYGRFRFSSQRYNELHTACRQFIEATLQEQHLGKTIVVTHHVPTFSNYPEAYRDSEISDGFATELSNLIFENDIDYWIYGHHHSNIPAFQLGKTWLCTNQMGYVTYGEHRDFDFGKVLEVASS
jgi:DNA repair exonuclease SbcCD nuclease subunit